MTQDLPQDGVWATSIREYLESRGDYSVELDWFDPMLEIGATYTGSRACFDCHTEEARHWLESGHASAMETLRIAQRHRVDNCVACHVVGFGTETGFDSRAGRVNGLEGVGCEVCHGPGSIHVEEPHVPGGIRRAPTEDVCAACHNRKHSEFLNGLQLRYFEQVRH